MERTIGRARLYKATVAGVLAVLLLTTAWMGTADASHVSCGAVITQSTVLHNDVGPCTSHGLVIGADGITLDLNGHRVFGIGVPGDGGVGVLVDGRTGVQVVNGTISDFDAGVAIEGGSGHKIERVTARDNIGTLLGPYGDGIAINNSADNLVKDSRVERNGPFSGIGLFGASTHNTLNRNTILDNNIPGDARNQDDGIRLEPGTSHSTVVNNDVRGSGLDGIAVFARSTDNYIGNNVVEANGYHLATHRKGDGIRVFSTGDRNQVRDNQVFDNAANGIRVDSVSNEIRDNKTGRNASAAGSLPAYDLHDSNVDCADNVWAGNTFDTAFPECTTG